MHVSMLRLVAEDPSGVGRPVPIDTSSDEPVDAELVSNGCDLKVEDVPAAATTSGERKPAAQAGVTLVGNKGPPGAGVSATSEAAGVSSNVKKVPCFVFFK